MTVLDYLIEELNGGEINENQFIEMIRNLPNNVTKGALVICLPSCGLSEELHIEGKYICKKCGTIKPF